MRTAFRVAGAHLFVGCETTESASLDDGGAEQTAPSETSPGVLEPKTKRRGLCCEKSLSPDKVRFRTAPNAGLTGRNQ